MAQKNIDKLLSRDELSDEKKRLSFELLLTQEYLQNRDDCKRDLLSRVNGIAAKAGASGYQFAGYKTLERFYRGDQWSSDEPAGASQRTDNYCSVIVDNISSLVFDDNPEVSCPTDDPTDDIQGIKAELKEKLIWRVWEDNDFEVEFDSWSKCGSLYGDGFLIGPYIDEQNGKKKIVFTHVENPAAISIIYADSNYKKILGFINSARISHAKANMLYGAQARSRGIKIEPSLSGRPENMLDGSSDVPMVNIDEYWTDKVFATFINDKLLDYSIHNWGFVPINYVKNIFVPNLPFGKSDIEDVLDPQQMHNRTNNDLANLLRWVSSINLWGKNLEGMQALVAGLSRIYSLPDDGEIHGFEKTGSDPYITNTFAQQRRSAIIELSGMSDQMMSGSQMSNASGRALALAFQGTIRKLNPRMKRYRSCLTQLNANILKLYEIYFPETKKIIGGDYRNKVFLPATILRNVVDTINKFQSGLISQETAMREVGVSQPKLEQKLMRKNLEDPLLGPQVARQPALLPRLSEGQNQPGEAPMPGPGQKFASQGGAVAANNQQSSGAAPTPQVVE